MRVRTGGRLWRVKVGVACRFPISIITFRFSGLTFGLLFQWQAWEAYSGLKSLRFPAAFIRVDLCPWSERLSEFSRFRSHHRYIVGRVEGQNSKSIVKMGFGSGVVGLRGCWRYPSLHRSTSARPGFSGIILGSPSHSYNSRNSWAPPVRSHYLTPNQGF